MKKINLLKYINGELDSKEQSEVLKWINSSRSRKSFFNCLKECYTLMTLPEKRATEADFADFLSNYDLNLPDNPKAIGRNRFRTALRFAVAVSAAAVVALLITIGIAPDRQTDLSGYNNIIANNTQELMLHNLPDGSMIGLSPNSEIRYSSAFNYTDRDLLLDGTCYFDVAKNKALPFKIQPLVIANSCNHDLDHKNAVIEVTGTKFYTTTVSSASNMLEIALKEGSVTVQMCNNGDKDHVSLTAGDYLEVSHNLKPVKSKIEEHGNPMMDAMKSFLRFSSAKLSDIIKKISRIHNCEFKITNPKISDYLLTADLAENTLADILSIFEVTMGVQSSINQMGVIELY